MSSSHLKAEENTITDTGERMVPAHHKGMLLYGEHILRYEAMRPFVDGKRVLDIASGSGYGTQMIAKTAESVIGVDNNEDAIAYAKSHYQDDNITYTLGSATKIPLADASVDVVVSLETIEHIDEYSTFLKEIKRVLVPDGVAIISTPNDIESPEGNHYHVHEFLYEEAYKVFNQYFSSVKPYFQGTWLYTALVDEEKMKSEWRGEVDTISLAPLKADQTMYYLFVCTNSKPTKVINSIGAISQHYSIKRYLETDSAMRKHMDDQKKVMDHLEAQLNKVSAQKRELEGHPVWRLVGAANKLSRAIGLKK